jgi:hypothetical protein
MILQGVAEGYFLNYFGVKPSFYNWQNYVVPLPKARFREW